jgi:hypothetical protein
MARDPAADQAQEKVMAPAIREIRPTPQARAMATRPRRTNANRVKAKGKQREWGTGRGKALDLVAAHAPLPARVKAPVRVLAREAVLGRGQVPVRVAVPGRGQVVDAVAQAAQDLVAGELAEEDLEVDSVFAVESARV